jgi:hypothetical protein
MSAQPEFDQALVNELARCRKWIEAALKYSGGTHDFGDVASAIAMGKMQLWPNTNGCAVTEILVYPKKKVLHVFLAGGKMRDIVEMHYPAAEWGRQQGCTAMSIAGRKGWQRVLKKLGYDHQFTTLSVEI